MSPFPSNPRLQLPVTTHFSQTISQRLLAMSQPQPAPSYPPQPQKRYWTAGKLLALVLAILIGVSALAAGLYYQTALSVNPLGPNCTNGASNPPACNSFPPCSNGATNPPTCTNFPPCSNGANNPPACTTFSPCSNGATNPPACNIFPSCSNGATNYPTCTIFNTTTQLSCTPNGAFYTQSVSTTFGDSCTVTVSDTTIPTGSVGWSSYQQTVSATGPSCTLTGTTSSTSSCTNTISSPNGVFQQSITVLANYQGDNTHLSGSGQFTMTAPSTITVSGTVSPQNGCVGCSVTRVDFITSPSGQTYSTTSGTFTITLPNLQGYSVIIYWSGTFGSGSCTRFLTLNQFSNTATMSGYQC